MIKQGDAWGLAQGKSLTSDTILKFERKGQSHLLLNEYLTTQIAKTLGYRVSEMTFLHVVGFPVLEIKRFDRQTTVGADGKLYVKRRHTVDACQALGLPSTMKYERVSDGLSSTMADSVGVTFAKLFSLEAFAADRMAFVTDLLDWMLFNVVMGGSDAHGKNLSFFVGKKGLVMAPWYDLVSVELIDGVDHTMAMSVRGVFAMDGIGIKELLNECDKVGVTSGLLSERLTRLLEGLTALDLGTLLPDGLTESEKAVAKRFEDFIKVKIKKWHRALEIKAKGWGDVRGFRAKRRRNVGRLE
ncbi:MAG: HipA domain-containing protein [Sutterellaceae bacterium]|nr:HipA domain-containing protein [Sutterellaceae bacterium]